MTAISPGCARRSLDKGGFRVGQTQAHPILTPLLPANAGIQMKKLKFLSFDQEKNTWLRRYGIWFPAFAGMSGFV